ncbi:hypothetical protein [Labedaea rhizosphaerae]|uniref:Uncharacterized protein n=1 Tax=Labedaea rhizosphaerae TaxID=598644 RepID=A0A4R6RUB2_LABRH|nr:hypothetical protein [Labedaea rhizosphaerae]TDP90549.1 hypothetical protein EV186_11090 [Labedaea rhizosphaerae]
MRGKVFMLMTEQEAPSTRRLVRGLLALGYPEPSRVYTSPISRFEADRLFTFV